VLENLLIRQKYEKKGIVYAVTLRLNPT